LRFRGFEKARKDSDAGSDGQQKPRRTTSSSPRRCGPSAFGAWKDARFRFRGNDRQLKARTILVAAYGPTHARVAKLTDMQTALYKEWGRPLPAELQ